MKNNIIIQQENTLKSVPTYALFVEKDVYNNETVFEKEMICSGLTAEEAKIAVFAIENYTNYLMVEDMIIANKDNSKDFHINDKVKVLSDMNNEYEGIITGFDYKLNECIKVSIKTVDEIIEVRVRPSQITLLEEN